MTLYIDLLRYWGILNTRSRLKVIMNYRENQITSLVFYVNLCYTFNLKTWP